jgi:hypothetical protein
MDAAGLGLVPLEVLLQSPEIRVHRPFLVAWKLGQGGCQRVARQGLQDHINLGRYQALPREPGSGLLCTRLTGRMQCF